MKKILFSHSYFLRFDPKQWKAAQPYAPLGTIYAAALMRENGYEVSLFDTMFVKSPEEAIDPIKEIQPDIFVVYDDGFNYLTKMCLSNMREAAFKMIKIAKENGCKVLVSSSDSSDHYEKYINEGADFILMGEAELSLLELVNAINSDNQDYHTIAGLAYKQDDIVIKTAKRDVMTNLDSLPLPAWDLVDMRPYKEIWLNSKGYFAMNMSTTRGCPFKCNWCAKPIYGNRYNSRTPAHVVQELKYLKEQYNFDYIWFCDDIFGLKPKWTAEFSELVKKEGLKFKFKIQSRADLLLQDHNIKALADAGCDDVWIGAESGSQKILDAMDKGTSVEQITESTTLLKKHHIKVSFFIQFGYLGETLEDIHATLNMITTLLPDDIGISVSYPLPGTVFYEKVKLDLICKTNWTDSDELAMMFKNTYTPAFYKQLHRYTHSIYRKKKVINRIKPFMKLMVIKDVCLYFLYSLKCIIDKKKLKSLENIF